MNMSRFDHLANYLICGDDAQCLERLSKRLYGDGTKLSSDERRDMADQLNHLLGWIQKIPDS